VKALISSVPTVKPAAVVAKAVKESALITAVTIALSSLVPSFKIIVSFLRKG
jgi:hypothetical protein